MTRIIQLCSALLLALAAIGANAADYAGTTFEIELIVFERIRGMEQASETWPATPRLKYPHHWVDFNTAGEDSLLLAPATTKLDNKAAALNLGGSYRVLFHKAWHQVLQQKRNAPAILISGGDSFGGHTQLGGSITLSVSRYLHLSTNLWLSEFGTVETAFSCPRCLWRPAWSPPICRRPETSSPAPNPAPNPYMPGTYHRCRRSAVYAAANCTISTTPPSGF